MRSVMTSMPCSTSPLITRMTAFSLPGMVRDEKITRSPRERDVGDDRLAMREKRGARLALAAGAERHHLVRRQVAVDVQAAEVPHAVEIAGLARHLDDAIHGAPDHHDLAPAGAAAPRPPHARHVRREGGDRDARRRRRDQLAQALRATSASEGERPSRTALVESPISASSPRRRARAASPRRSASR